MTKYLIFVPSLMLGLLLWFWRVQAFAEGEASAAGAERRPEFVELGTPRAEVIQILGEPDRATVFESIKRETMYYGESRIELHKGLVVGWRNVTDLPIWMGDAQPDAAPVEVGSPPGQVLAVMGTPREIEYNPSNAQQNWRYGSSGIRFVVGKVLDWSNFGPLKVGKLERPEPIRSTMTYIPMNPAEPTAVASTTRTVSSPPSGSYSPKLGGGPVHVQSYTRRDGTQVRSHSRSR